MPNRRQLRSRATDKRGKHPRVIAVDVGTTGLSPSSGGRVIEVGAVALEKGEIVDEFQSLVFVETQISGFATMLHGITNDTLEGKPRPEEVFPRLRAFIREGILVAHDAPFDIGFLRNEFALLDLAFDYPHHCTLEMSKERYPWLPDHGLETMYRHLFGSDAVRNVRLHHALDEAKMAARLWIELDK